MDVGFEIRKLREAKELSQPELAHRLGISQTTLCNIESGKCKKIDFRLIEKICREFNLVFDYFFY